jgi:hypothetical protein
MYDSLGRAEPLVAVPVHDGWEVSPTCYPVLRSAGRFLAAYLTKEDDGRYHVFPSISSENWGCTVNFKLNRDCILDLVLTRFVLDAVVNASTILNRDEEERRRWKEIAENLAEYPRAEGSHGDVCLDISNAPPEHVYNVPITLAPVFPGEQVGIDRGKSFLEIASRTAETIRLEAAMTLFRNPSFELVSECLISLGSRARSNTACCPTVYLMTACVNPAAVIASQLISTS